MKWTQLEGTHVFNEAKMCYDDNELEYHNWNHILNMYRWADAFGIEYNIALDLAILAHDVVYDNEPFKEERSALWLMQYSALMSPLDLVRACKLILTTVDHTPNSNPGNDLIKLDLADFLSESRRKINMENIKDECIYLYGISDDEFYDKQCSFLLQLSTRLSFSGDRLIEAIRSCIHKTAIDTKEMILNI